MTALPNDRKGLRSGCGSDDKPPGIGKARAVAVEKRGKLQVRVGHRRCFALNCGRPLGERLPVMRPAAAYLAHRKFDAR